jgi:predicted MFS family arabinose efflux permease
MALLLWLALGAFAIGTEGFMIAGMLPTIAGDLGSSVEMTGHLVTAFAAAYALSSPILSSLFARVPRKPLLLGALTAFALGNLAAAAATTLAGLMLARVAIGIAAGVFVPAANAVAVGIAGPERRARAIAIVTGGLTLATALGVPIGTLVAALGSWRLSFVMVGALALIGIAGLAWGLPKALPVGASTLAERLAMARQPRVLLALASTLAWMTGAMTLYTYLAAFLADHAGLVGAQVSAALIVFGVGAALGNALGGPLADRLGALPTVLATVSSLCVIFAVMAAIAALLPAGPLAAALLLGAIGLWGFIGWGGYPAQAARLVSLAPEAATVTLSLNASALYFGIALGATLGSIVMSTGSSALLGLVAAACEAIAVVLVIQAHRMERPSGRLAAGHPSA